MCNFKLYLNEKFFFFYVCALGGATEEEEEMWGRVSSWAVRSVGTGHCCWDGPHLQYNEGRPALHFGKNSSPTAGTCEIWLKQLRSLVQNGLLETGKQSIASKVK